MRFLKGNWIVIVCALLIMACGMGPLPLAAHDVTLTWTAPTTMPAGSYINIYRGTTSGAESATPINAAGINPASLTYDDSSVLPNAKYFYVAKQCVIDLASSKEVCSAPSNEASTIVPMSSSDLAPPAMLGAIGK